MVAGARPCGVSDFVIALNFFLKSYKHYKVWPDLRTISLGLLTIYNPSIMNQNGFYCYSVAKKMFFIKYNMNCYCLTHHNYFLIMSDLFFPFFINVYEGRRKVPRIWPTCALLPSQTKDSRQHPRSKTADWLHSAQILTVHVKYNRKKGPIHLSLDIQVKEYISYAPWS